MLKRRGKIETMSENISILLNKEQQETLKTQLVDFGLPSNNPYITFFAKKDDITISLYSSGKCLFQGKDASKLASQFTSSPQRSATSKTVSKISNESSLILPQAGSDEVGTGDVFGPVVVVASYVDETIYEQINSLNINDSKALTDEAIISIAPKLMEIVPNSCLILDNKKYNQVHSQYNLNGLKAILHNSAYVHLQAKLGKLPDFCIVDQFAPKAKYYSYLTQQAQVIKTLHFETKAESHYISVAVSSMIARYLFLQAMDQLSNQVGFTLHKGAGKLVDDDIQRLINEKGKAILPYVAKCHFSNIQKYI